MARRRRGPTLRLERECWDAGADVVVGLDEVGRGAWAGPLTIAAVVLPRDRRVYGVRDSKQLTEARREQLFDRVKDWCDAVGVGHVEHDECDALGMSDAQRLAARRALDALGVVPDEVLVDGPWDFVGGGSTRTVVRGDATSLSIAAASIVAKVSRDRIMRERRRALPGVRPRPEQGLPVPPPQAGAQGVRPDADPPTFMGVHGQPAVAVPPPRARGGPGRPVRGPGVTAPVQRPHLVAALPVLFVLDHGSRDPARTGRSWVSRRAGCRRGCP